MISVSFKNIQRNKVRTFLALLGIMIGVASIISLVSIVDGLFAQVQDVEAVPCCQDKLYKVASV